MGQILSHAEVESILAGLNLAPGLPQSDATTAAAAEAEVSTYDFEHPIPLGRAQLDSLRLACAAITQSLQTGLTDLFRSPTLVDFLGVEQSTYRDYLATSEQPACVAVYEASAARGVWLIDVSRTLAFTMIDCLLGGTPSAQPPATALERPFTELESRFIEKAMQTVLPELTASVCRQISLKMARIVSDGSLLVESQSNEAVALVSYEVICGQSQGLLQLCVPWAHVAQDSRSFPVEPTQLKELMRLGACKVPVTATARVTRLKLSARDLASLSPGDVLLTDAPADSEMSLEVGGREIFRGTTGQIHDRRVLRLTSPVTDEPPELTGDVSL